MIHSVEHIADTMYLDREIARNVAVDNKERFGVVMYDDAPCVSTFHCNEFVEAVKDAQGKETPAIRARRIAELYPPQNLPLDTRPSKG